MSIYFVFAAIITSLSDNLISPTGSLVSSNQSGSAKSPSDQSTPTNGDRNAFPLATENVQQQKQQQQRNDTDNKSLKEAFTPTSDMNRLRLANELSPAEVQSKHLQQPRNRLGLLLPLSVVEIPSPVSDTTPTQTPVQPRSKQGSPFYAEPADALGNVIRRSQRNAPVAPAHRHSEPPKGPARVPLCQVLSPIESEKSHHISGSLDELKKKNNRKAHGRMDPWPVDSSWEFLGNDDPNDYDSDANWKTSTAQKKNDIAMLNGGGSTKNLHLPPKDQKMTLNQIIAKRLPDMKIPELIMKATLPISALAPDTPRSEARNGIHRQGSRLSSYDNVGHSGYATTSIFNQSSAHSDDGTVFSEPWDSSQWDSFLPHGDGKSFISYIATTHNQHIDNFISALQFWRLLQKHSLSRFTCPDADRPFAIPKTTHSWKRAPTASVRNIRRSWPPSHGRVAAEIAKYSVSTVACKSNFVPNLFHHHLDTLTPIRLHQ